MFFDTVSHINGRPRQEARTRCSEHAELPRCQRGLRNFDIVCDHFFIIPYWGAMLGSA